MESKTYMTRAEAAELLRVTTRTIIRWEQDGKLEPHGGGRTVLYDRGQVERLAAYGRAKAAAPEMYRACEVDEAMAGVDPEALWSMAWGDVARLAGERGVTLDEVAAWQRRALHEASTNSSS